MHICHVAFPISKSAYTHFKKKKSIFRIKPKQEPPPPPKSMHRECNTAGYRKPRLLTQPGRSCTEKTSTVAGREFLLEGKPLYVRPSSVNGMIFMPSRFGSQTQIHMCSALVLGFRLPRPAPGHVQIRILLLSFLQPFQNMFSQPLG